VSRPARRFLLALVLGTLAVLGVVIFRLGPGLLLAAVLAVVLWPARQWLTARFRGRRGPAASLLVFGVTTLIIAPVAALSAFVVREATEAVGYIISTVESEGVEGLLERLPGPLARLGETALGLLPKDVAGQGAPAIGAVVTATGSMLFQTVMMLIALFFFLTSGEECLAFLDRASPLKQGQTRELLAEVKKVSSSLFVSVIGTAAVQAGAALTGYLIARVPHPLFFTAVTFILAMVPVVGAAAVGLVAAGLLFLTGHPWAALFLAVWSVVVVGLIDNLVKPLLVKGGSQLDGAVVFFALVGGVAAFGGIGLLVAPLTVALFLAALRMRLRTSPPRRTLTDRHGARREGSSSRPRREGRERLHPPPSPLPR
jgi:predicted PurR-regulated permease PerM